MGIWREDRERRNAYYLNLHHEGKTWAKRNPDKVRAKRRRRTLKAYNLTPQQWDAMLAAQGNRCAICRTDEPGSAQWHTDHCHATNTTRGILCKKCNNAIGQMQDSPSILRSAAAYIEKFRDCPKATAAGPSDASGKTSVSVSVLQPTLLQ